MMMRRLLHRLGMHCWRRAALSDSSYEYHECSICGARTARRADPAVRTYSPVAGWWLDGRDDAPPIGEPPHEGSGVSRRPVQC